MTINLSSCHLPKYKKNRQVTMKNNIFVLRIHSTLYFCIIGVV